jgi:transcriptional regulator with PAS, ATPase and Fis domain
LAQAADRDDRRCADVAVQARLARINREMHRGVARVRKDVLRCFEAQESPGNVRELE